jgi:hypothetical protein
MELRKFLLSTLLLCSAVSCVSWKPYSEQLGPETTISGPSRVTMSNRSVVYLRSGAVTGDSLIGKIDDRKGQRSALALSDVNRLDRQRLSKSKTLLAILGGVIAAGIVYENTRPPCRDCISLFK